MSRLDTCGRAGNCQSTNGEGKRKAGKGKQTIFTKKEVINKYKRDYVAATNAAAVWLQYPDFIVGAFPELRLNVLFAAISMFARNSLSQTPWSWNNARSLSLTLFHWSTVDRNSDDGWTLPTPPEYPPYSPPSPHHH